MPAKNEEQALLALLATLATTTTTKSLWHTVYLSSKSQENLFTWCN